MTLTQNSDKTGSWFLLNKSRPFGNDLIFFWLCYMQEKIHLKFMNIIALNVARTKSFDQKIRWNKI